VRHYIGSLVLASFCAVFLSLSGVPAQAAVFHPETYTLANGMQVVIVKNRLSAAVAQMVWIKTGAADDPAGHSGLAHYLEHMMFKGTATLPTGGFSALIAAQGGEENAFTTHDTTAYHEVIAADRLGLVMALEADRLHALRFAPDEAKSELAVVMSERQERTDNEPQGIFWEKMAAALYGAHPYGRPVIGWQNEIASITPDDARAFYRQAYAPDNAILVVSGNVETQDVLRLASGTFGRLASAGDVAPRKVKPLRFAPASPKPQKVEMHDPRVTQPIWVRQILLPQVKADSRLSFALDVLSEILSSGEVGLLHRHFVMEKQTASAMAASYDSVRRGPVSFSLTAVPAPQADPHKLEKEIDVYLQALAKRGFSAAEIGAAQRRLEDAAIFARDRLMAPAQILGEALAVGQTMSSVEDWPDHIRAVTPADVSIALRTLLASPHAVTGLLAPAKGASE